MHSVWIWLVVIIVVYYMWRPSPAHPSLWWTATCHVRTLLPGPEGVRSWQVLLYYTLSHCTSQQLSALRTKLSPGKHACSFAAPVIWNEFQPLWKLSESLSSFCKNLMYFQDCIFKFHSRSLELYGVYSCPSQFFIMVHDSGLMRFWAWPVGI